MEYTNQDLLDAIAKYNELDPIDYIINITPELYEEHKNILPIFEFFASKGDSRAECYLGLCYYKGKGVSKNEVKAEELLEKASSKDDAVAQYKLGRFINQYYAGMGVDYLKRARDLFEKSAKAGYVPAMYEVAEGYLLIERNREIAAYWHQKGADNGDISCIKALAIAYFGGRGVEQNYEKAISLWQQAYNMGDLDALASIASCYASGNGVDKDYAKALKMYQEVIQNIKGGTVFYQKRAKEIQDALIKEGRCQHCGGKFKGLFSKKCSSCGKKKDYK